MATTPVGSAPATGRTKRYGDDAERALNANHFNGGNSVVVTILCNNGDLLSDRGRSNEGVKDRNTPLTGSRVRHDACEAPCYFCIDRDGVPRRLNCRQCGDSVGSISIVRHEYAYPW